MYQAGSCTATVVANYCGPIYCRELDLLKYYREHFQTTIFLAKKVLNKSLRHLHCNLE